MPLREFAKATHEFGTRHRAVTLGNRRGSGRERCGLPLRPLRLAAAVGFNILALAIQYE